MKPVEFKQQTDTIAKNQPLYLPLPAHINREDDWRPVTSCWKMSFVERLRTLLTGKVWVQQCIFGGKLQPQKLSTKITDMI